MMIVNEAILSLSTKCYVSDQSLACTMYSGNKDPDVPYKINAHFVGLVLLVNTEAIAIQLHSITCLSNEILEMRLRRNRSVQVLKSKFNGLRWK